MISDFERWKRDGKSCRWKMPTAPAWRRLPIIRHMRAIFGAVQVSRYESVVRGMGMIPTGYDSWVLYGIWHGHERPLAGG